MSAFDFFFSFYGLVLGLSVTVIATGAARAFKHRRTIHVGWKTPLLATFAALDIATFWDAAWQNYREASYSYGLLVGGLVIAVVYFIAASLIFPEPADEVENLDDHFWANKRGVLLLLVAANLLMVSTLFWRLLSAPGEHSALIAAYVKNTALYLALVLPAAFSRRVWLVAGALGLHIVIYLYYVVITVVRTGG